MSELDDEARRFARFLASRKGSSGHQPPPTIDVSESSLDPEGFNRGFMRPGRAESVGGGGGGGGVLPPPPTGACCVAGVCSIHTEADCDAAGGTYQGNFTDCTPDPCIPTCPPSNLCTLDLSFTSGVYSVSQTGLAINPNVCGTLGWNAKWVAGCGSTSCGQATNYCGSVGSGCVCGVRFDWYEFVGSAVDFSYVRIILDKLSTGWYLWASAHMENGTGTSCYWESAYCTSTPCTCVFLGSDDSIFDSILPVTITLVEDPFFPCAGNGTLNLTFYPC